MKKILLAATALSVLASSALAYDIKVGVRTMAMDYSEYKQTDGSLLDTEESGLDPMMGGLELSIAKAFSKNESGYTKVEFNTGYVYGNSDYIGSVLGSGNPYGSLRSKTLNTIIDTDLAVKEYSDLDGYDLYVGASIGYRFWKRELSVNQVEDYKWFYAKAMIGGTNEINSEWSIGLEAYYKYAINPIMTASNDPEDFELGGVNTVGLTIPITYKYSEKMSFYVDNVIEQQKIKESTVNTSGLLEPRSTSNDYYLKMGVIFKY
jgi:opacity protein-like surface antigen